MNLLLQNLRVSRKAKTLGGMSGGNALAYSTTKSEDPEGNEMRGYIKNLLKFVEL